MKAFRAPTPTLPASLGSHQEARDHRIVVGPRGREGGHSLGLGLVSFRAGRPAARLPSAWYLAKQHSQWLPLSLTVSTQVKAGQEKSSSPMTKRRSARRPRPFPGLWNFSSPSIWEGAAARMTPGAPLPSSNAAPGWRRVSRGY